MAAEDSLLLSWESAKSLFLFLHTSKYILVNQQHSPKFIYLEINTTKFNGNYSQAVAYVHEFAILKLFL